MAKMDFNSELLVDMFGDVLSTIDGTVTSTSTSEGNLQVGKASLLVTSHVKINKFIDTFKEGENFTILFKKVDNGLV